MESGIPIPDVLPGKLLPPLILAEVSYFSNQNCRKGAKAEHEASRRFLSQRYRCSEHAIDSALTALRSTRNAKVGPWLEVSTPARALRGHHYSPSGQTATDLTKWVRFGRFLFGPAGVLTPLMARPILLPSPKGIGLHQGFVLGLVSNAGPISRADLVRSVRGLMGARTAYSAISRLLGNELLLLDDGDLIVPRNLDQRIRRDELHWGATQRAREIDEMLGAEQFFFQTAVAGGPTVTRIKSLLRKRSCFYCAAEPSPEGGDVEHFPPVHWGGSDTTSLLLPACRRCNRSHGSLIKQTPKLPAPSPSVRSVEFPGDHDTFRKFMLEVMMMQAARYAMCLNERDIEGAMEAATSIFPLWMSLKSGVTVIDTTTGEVGPMRETFSLDVIDHVNDSLGGIPAAVDVRLALRRESEDR